MAGLQNVPIFFVYGEPPRSLDTGFLHVEKVRDRNSAHFGHVAAHRHMHMGQITFWTSGSGTYRIENTDWHFSAPAVSFVPSAIVHGFTIDEGADATVVSIADSRLKDIASGTALSLDSPTFFSGSADDPTWRRLAGTIEAIAEEYSEARPDGRLIMSGLIALAFSFVARLDANPPALSVSPQVLLASRFRRAVDANFRRDWTVRRYVELLNTTEHLLARASTQVFRAAPKDVVLERRLLEAKRLLRFTIRSVEDIGFEIGFKDPSYFSRFFRSRCGMSPKLWRAGQMEPGTFDS